MAIVCCERIKDEMGSAVFWRDVVVEVICSGMLLCYITFTFITFNNDLYAPNTTSVGIMVGFWVMLLVEAFGPISGAHMNPAVTFTMTLLRRISVVRGIFYTIAACIGGVGGSYLAYHLTPPETRAFKAFRPAEGLGVVRGMLLETLLTFALCFVGSSVTDEKSRGKHSLPGLPIGFTVGTGIIATGTFTGACMNPIVALGPATISQDFSDHWIYWAGGYAGGFIAFAVYATISYIKRKNQEADGASEAENYHSEEVKRLLTILDERSGYERNGNRKGEKDRLTSI